MLANDTNATAVILLTNKVHFNVAATISHLKVARQCLIIQGDTILLQEDTSSAWLTRRPIKVQHWSSVGVSVPLPVRGGCFTSTSNPKTTSYNSKINTVLLLVVLDYNGRWIAMLNFWGLCFEQ